MPKTTYKWMQYFAWMLVVLGLVGLVASFILTIERIELLKNPEFIPSCNINPLLSCGSIMKTPQAAAFGFPNPLIGIMSFPLVITAGVVLLAGGKLKKWFWQLFNLGTLLGLLFVHWLIYQSVFNIGALCIYCMVVWTVVIPIFLYTTLWNLNQGNCKTPKACRSTVAFANRHHASILLVWYLLILGTILVQFWDRI